MTLARLLAAALVVCSGLALAQTKADSLLGSDQPAATTKPATAASSEPWKFIPNQPADSTAERNPVDRLQTDKYKVFRSLTDTRTLLLGPDADAGMFLSGIDGPLGAEATCYKIRSYVVARDSRNSDSTHPVSYSTCQPAARYQLRTTEIRSGSADR
jgi:hypothetical protein